MNSEPLRERQKMLQRERQQRCRQGKRQSGKENVPPHPKRRKENPEIDESSKNSKGLCLSMDFSWIRPCYSN